MRLNPVATSFKKICSYFRAFVASFEAFLKTDLIIYLNKRLIFLTRGNPKQLQLTAILCSIPQKISIPSDKMEQSFNLDIKLVVRTLCLRITTLLITMNLSIRKVEVGGIVSFQEDFNAIFKLMCFKCAFYGFKKLEELWLVTEIRLVTFKNLPDVTVNSYVLNFLPLPLQSYKGNACYCNFVTCYFLFLLLLLRSPQLTLNYFNYLLKLLDIFLLG